MFGLFLKKKSDLAEEGVRLIRKIKGGYNIDIKIICCDNADENKYLQKELFRRWSESDLQIHCF